MICRNSTKHKAGQACWQGCSRWQNVFGAGLRCLVLLVMVTVVALLHSCARLPDYARPQFSVPGDNADGGVNGGFSYRELRIDDFHASDLPTRYAGYNHNIQARSCINVRPADTTLMSVGGGDVSGMQVYSGSFTRITFHAAFNPDCSWWRKSIPQSREGYVLKHEQIHFALTELSARKINRLYRVILEQYVAFGDSIASVQQDLLAEAKRVSRKVLEEDMSRHLAFDEDTSLNFDAEVQQRWYEEVVAELLDSAEESAAGY